MLYGFGKKPPPEKIAQGGFPRRFDKPVVIKARRFAVHFKNSGFKHCGAVLCGVLRHGHSRPLGKKLYCFNIFKVLNPPYKADYVAARSAAEAIEGLAFRVHGKRTRFFGMEGAKPHKNTPAALELNI